MTKEVGELYEIIYVKMLGYISRYKSYLENAKL